MNENRRAERIDVPLLVEYRPIGASEWQSMTQGKNVSRSGLCFWLKNQIPVGTKIEVRMSIVENPILQVIATSRIVWVKAAGVVGQYPFQAGLEFIQVDPEEISNLLKSAYLYWKEVIL